MITHGCNQSHSPSKDQGLDCSKLKTGVFIVQNNTPYIKSEITRKGNLQIEKNLIDGSSDSVKIDWINDCIYTLVNKRSTNSEKLTVEIIKIVDDTILMRGSYPNIAYKPEMKMIKIR